MERILEADITDFDLRYESCRIRDQKIEDNLLLSILKSGIRDPLRGIEGEKTKILGSIRNSQISFKGQQ